MDGLTAFRPTGAAPLPATTPRAPRRSSGRRGGPRPYPPRRTARRAPAAAPAPARRGRGTLRPPAAARPPPSSPVPAHRGTLGSVTASTRTPSRSASERPLAFSPLLPRPLPVRPFVETVLTVPEPPGPSARA